MIERMMSECFTWIPFGGLREPEIYHQSVCFTMCGGFYLVRCSGRESILP